MPHTLHDDNNDTILEMFVEHSIEAYFK